MQLVTNGQTWIEPIQSLAGAKGNNLTFCGIVDCVIEKLAIGCFMDIDDKLADGEMKFQRHTAYYGRSMRQEMGWRRLEGGRDACPTRWAIGSAISECGKESKT